MYIMIKKKEEEEEEEEKTRYPIFVLRKKGQRSKFRQTDVLRLSKCVDTCIYICLFYKFHLISDGLWIFYILI